MLGPDGITVNNVLPGFTETDRLEEVLGGMGQRSGKSRKEVIAQLQASVPLRRFARAEETAAAVAFLASPAASYISGINLPVDGGRTGSL
jgi:3-oxoacyl-[acyl-carrier protein] reductase